MRLQTAIFASTASYLTLGLFDSSTASSLWAVYALVVFALTVLSVVFGWVSDRRRTS